MRRKSKELTNLEASICLSRLKSEDATNDSNDFSGELLKTESSTRTFLKFLDSVVPIRSWLEEPDKQERKITFDGNGVSDLLPLDEKFPKNAVNNQKYSVWSFIPMFLWDQFKQFSNAYFLCIALTQVPVSICGFSPFECFWIGTWWTFVAPLLFVLFIALCRETYDHYCRWKQDKAINDELFHKITSRNSEESDEEMELNQATTTKIKSSHIKIGDLIMLKENERVPCDMVLLWCSNSNETTFIRTDQLDGETDWKLRKPVACIQSEFKDDNADNAAALIHKVHGTLKVEAPHQKIYEFMGAYTDAETGKSEGLNLENTLWSTTVIASGNVIGAAIYCGKDTRAALNANEAKFKMGLIDRELNFYSKVLFISLIVLSSILTLSRGLHASWYIFLGRFIILLSAIIPISLRVHMDWAKMYFSWNIGRDKKIPGSIMRTTTIPEELGRIDYLFSDKTGTLTQNEMVFKKLQLQPPLLYDEENLQSLKKIVKYGFNNYCGRIPQCSSGLSAASASSLNDEDNDSEILSSRYGSFNSICSDNNPDRSNSSRNSLVGFKSRKQRKVIGQVIDIMEALAVCHNVTPILTKDHLNNITNIDYQASSPDEIALVKFTEDCGLTLISRDDTEIRLKMDEKIFEYEILNVFPFTSETKRMGIILRNKQAPNDEEQIVFFAKGADAIMRSMIDQISTEWMDEEVENLAREGLRTLVFAKKFLPKHEYAEFVERYEEASSAMTNNRSKLMESVRERLELDMNLIGISGVEDKLQDEVQSTLEILKQAHIKVWMLTGDKVETAQVIARSSKLVGYGESFFSLIAKNAKEAIRRLDLLGAHKNAAIVIDGKSLDVYLKYCKKEFIAEAVEALVVICCRCSPTQKAEMVELVRAHTGKICAAIGDGGNDVAMIQSANIGIGICGKEGQQASLAADVSIDKFEYVARLILWHGRLSYKNTAKMAQFIMHRGAIIALIQCLFSVIFYISAIPLFSGIVAVGYTCAYTVAPVTSLMLDADITSRVAIYYPELYHALQKGSSLNHKTVLLWTVRSVFQAGIIMLCSMYLFDGAFHSIMTISFTALIIVEIFNIMIEIKRWHWLMIVAEVGSMALYFASIFIPMQAFENFFDIVFVTTWKFWAKSAFTGLVAVAPMAFIKLMAKKINPAAHAKLKDFKRQPTS